MVRILIDRAFSTALHYIEAVGLSTDTKPTGDIITGSKFTEIDTGSNYLYDEESGEWLKFPPDPSAAEENAE